LPSKQIKKFPTNRNPGLRQGRVSIRWSNLRRKFWECKLILEGGFDENISKVVLQNFSLAATNL
jgi:hypothetical protein